MSHLMTFTYFSVFKALTTCIIVSTNHAFVSVIWKILSHTYITYNPCVTSIRVSGLSKLT